MKVLVFSHHHHLLPFAWRLHREGVEVETAVWRDRYSRAWEGRLPKVLPPKPTPEDLAPFVESALTGELVVVTDSQKGQEAFAGALHLYGMGPTQPFSRLPNLLYAGWFTGEDELKAPHWLVPDWGLWPGGLGPAALGGCTLLKTPRNPSLSPEYAAILRGANFRGLVSVGMEYVEASGELAQVGFLAGWNFLFTHLFVSGLQNFAATLAGEEPILEEKNFVVGLPVSIPPYPIQNAPGAAQVRLEGVTNDLARQCFFHDFTMKGSELWTAGLDGLVAVVRGSGNSLAAAQGVALAVSTALPLPQKQFRLDVGGRVPTLLVGLERLGYL